METGDRDFARDKAHRSGIHRGTVSKKFAKKHGHSTWSLSRDNELCDSISELTNWNEQRQTVSRNGARAKTKNFRGDACDSREQGDVKDFSVSLHSTVGT